MTEGVFQTVGIRHARADAETIAEFLSRTGYLLPVAIADLIDNAVDAGASRVHVGLLFRTGRPATLAIADNGRGMTQAELERAVSLQKDPRKQDGRSLGRYGAGLKAASFSLGRVLTIATRARLGAAIGAVLDQQHYRDNFEYSLLTASSATTILDSIWSGRRLGRTGTVLLISELSAMVPRSDTSQNLFLEGFEKDLDVRLGLIFHRFIQSSRLTITKAKRLVGGELDEEFDVHEIAPVDPFGYPASGHRSYPMKLTIDTGRSKVPVVLHLWPKQGRTKATRDQSYEILGRSGEWQGFYFYRWDRLLQAGGWNGLLSQEPHMSYARLVVDLPPGSDDEFRPTVMKDRIENARPLLEVLTTNRAWSTYIAAARTVYRGGTKTKGKGAWPPPDSSPQIDRPVFIQMSRRPSVRIKRGRRLELDRRLVRLLGKPKADAVGELVWQAISRLAGRKRLSAVMKQDLARLEEAVAILAGRRK